MNKISILLFFIGMFLGLGFVSNLAYSWPEFSKHLLMFALAIIVFGLVIFWMSIKYRDVYLKLLLGMAVGCLVFASINWIQELPDEVNKIIFITSYSFVIVLTIVTVVVARNQSSQPSHPFQPSITTGDLENWPAIKQQIKFTKVLPVLNKLSEIKMDWNGEKLPLLDLSTNAQKEVIADCTVKLVNDFVLKSSKEGKLDQSMLDPIVGASLTISLSVFGGNDWVNFEQDVYEIINKWFNKGVIPPKDFVNLQVEILGVADWMPCKSLEGVSETFPLEYQQQFEQDIQSIGIDEEPFQQYVDYVKQA